MTANPGAPDGTTKATLVEALKACDDVEAEPYVYHDPVTGEERRCLLLYVGGI